MERNYRVTVRGRFRDLDAAQQERLRSEQADHDVFNSRFSPEGTFLYQPELINFQFRYALTITGESPGDAEVLAQAQAEESAQWALHDRGLGAELLKTTVVSMDDMKIRKRTRS